MLRLCGEPSERVPTMPMLTMIQPLYFAKSVRNGEVRQREFKVGVLFAEVPQFK